jgi:hypothetical protein
MTIIHRRMSYPQIMDIGLVIWIYCCVFLYDVCLFLLHTNPFFSGEWIRVMVALVGPEL